jgi:hypothetical protein
MIILTIRDARAQFDVRRSPHRRVTNAEAIEPVCATRDASFEFSAIRNIVLKYRCR